MGAVRGSDRLHWTMAAARAEAPAWIDEIKIAPIIWSEVDDRIVIGRSDAYYVVLRSILLPEGVGRAR